MITEKKMPNLKQKSILFLLYIMVLSLCVSLYIQKKKDAFLCAHPWHSFPPSVVRSLNPFGGRPRQSSLFSAKVSATWWSEGRIVWKKKHFPAARGVRSVANIVVCEECWVELGELGCDALQTVGLRGSSCNLSVTLMSNTRNLADDLKRWTLLEGIPHIPNRGTIYLNQNTIWKDL